MNPERKIIASTASTGVFGTPSHWKEEWDFALSDPRFKGFEMIGWGGKGMRFWTDALLQRAGEIGCDVVGIHGRTVGPMDIYTDRRQAWSLWGLNQSIVPTPELIKRYSRRSQYILVHASEMRTPENRIAALVFKKRIRNLYLENHVTHPIDSDTAIVYSMRLQGVPAGVMFDMAHYQIYESHIRRNSTYQEIWSGMMAALTQLLTEKDFSGHTVPVGLHVPIGTFTGDSIPTDEITGQMWKDFVARIEGRGDVFIVIENPVKGRDQIRTTVKTRREQRERNIKIVDLLTDNGVV
jgi:hypothetical protein